MPTTRRRFRALLAEPALTVMPGAYDALSARLIEAAGFPAIVAGGYAAIGSMLAEPDGGQSNVRDYAEHYARIAGSVDIPVFADADTGFGGPGNVRRMMRMFEAAGVAGILLGDQTFPNRCGYLPGKQVVPVAEMLLRIRAAVDARRDPDLVIVARTDVTAIDGLDAAIERCRLYLAAGADLAKPQGIDTLPALQRVVREVTCPHIATQSQAAQSQATNRTAPSFAELGHAGVSAVTLPSLALFAAAEGVRRVLDRVAADRSTAGITESLIGLERYYDVVGLDGQNAREQRLAAEAEAITAAHCSGPLAEDKHQRR